MIGVIEENIDGLGNAENIRDNNGQADRCWKIIKYEGNKDSYERSQK